MSAPVEVSLLAPGTVPKPAWIDDATWSRVPWPARWRLAKQEPARLARVARQQQIKALLDDQAARRRLALYLDEVLDQAVVIPTDPPEVTARRREQLLKAIA